jgi:hypothetical protein
MFTDPGTPGILFESPSVNVWLPFVGLDLPISVPDESLKTYVNGAVPPEAVAIISVSHIEFIVNAKAGGAVSATTGESASQPLDIVVSIYDSVAFTVGIFKVSPVPT